MMLPYSFLYKALRSIRRLYPFHHRKRYKEIQQMKNTMHNATQNSTENTTFHDEYARVSNIFECNEAILTYYMDYAGKHMLYSPFLSDDLSKTQALYRMHHLTVT